MKSPRDFKPSQPPGERSPADSGVSPKPGSDKPPMDEKGMEATADQKKLSQDAIIEIRHQSGRWFLKKNEEQYWHRKQKDARWRDGLPSGLTAQEASDAFKAG